VNVEEASPLPSAISSYAIVNCKQPLAKTLCCLVGHVFQRNVTLYHQDLSQEKNES
jgi:hypothetical protein